MADLRPYPGTPRWVKILGIIVIVLVVLFATLHLSGSEFGPGMHMNPGMQMQPTEHSVQQP